MPAPAPAPIDVDALIAAPVKRTLTYRVPVGAATYEFGDHLLSRGTHGKSGAPSLVLTNGTAQSGIPIGAVTLALLRGLISRDEVKAIWSAADAEAAAA